MRLRELRKNRGLRQKDIAEKIGVSPQSYGYYENGINKPDPEMLIKLANFFQCSTDYLLGREDDFGNIVVQGTEDPFFTNITIQTEKPAPLPQDEQEFLTMYRALPSYLKDSIFSELKGMYKAYLASKSEKTTRRA